MPVIVSKGPISAEIGDTITIDELADIDKSVESKIMPTLEGYDYGEKNESGAKVSDDGQSVFVGNEECEFDVTVYVVGTNSERREKRITVKVYQKGKLSTSDEIILDEKQYVTALKQIKISGTNDFVTITENVKWDVPEHESGETVSFSISIPYTIVVDGEEYNGIYELNDSSWSIDDENLKYDFRVTNLTEDGEIEIVVSKK